MRGTNMDTLTPVANNPIERMKQTTYNKVVRLLKEDNANINEDKLGSDGTYISKATLWKVLNHMKTVAYSNMYNKVNGVLNRENSLTIHFNHEQFNYCDTQGKMFVGQTEIEVHDNLLVRFYITRHYNVTIQLQYDVTTLVTMYFPPMI
ncbi:hypothetical protein [Bacillus thuringiensis]|nr:hypothetical protein [Bacillus thuringiensis]